jgi:Methyltransferase domain
MSCVICQGETIRGRDYQWCHECHTVRTDYGYDPSIYNAAYAENYRKLAGTELSDRINRSRLDLVESFMPARAEILDVGCGMGEFLRLAEREHTCYGWEPCINAKYSRLNGLAGLGAITFFDVFEHLENPVESLWQFRTRLGIDGVIVMVLPNVDAVPFGNHARLQAWKHFKPREHLFLYGKTGLRRLAETVGMNIIYSDTIESTLRPNNPNHDIISVVMQ